VRKFHIFTAQPTFPGVLNDPEDDPAYSETLTAEDHKDAAEVAEGPTMLGAVMYLWVLADGDLAWGAERFAVWLVPTATPEHAPKPLPTTPAPAAPGLWSTP